MSISKRYDFVIFFDVKNGNPNGDPDSGGSPRIDPETGHGIVTDVCIKRKIRNYVQTVRQCAERYDIYIRGEATLNAREEEICEKTLGKKSPKKGNSDEDALLFKAVCNHYYDIRTFGCVLTTFVKASLNCGQIRGPVQLNFARSIDPISPQELTITRMAVTTAEDSDNLNTMGRKSIVPYGLYRANGTISAHLAQKTGFDQDDLELLWEAILNMFENDRSAMRGEMTVRKLLIFEHSSALGEAPSYALMDTITAKRKDSVTIPRQFDDYEICVDHSAIPDSVTLIPKR